MALGQREYNTIRGWYVRPDVVSALLLIGTGILFFSDPLFSSKNFYFRDILNFHYPLRKVLIDSYARGEFPLWNPYIYLGQPMLANPNYMAFYPTNLFHLFLPFNYAFKLHFVIHPLLGGLGLYLLQRRLGIQPIAAFGGSLVYQFSGPVLSFLNLYNLVPSVALMPWTAWALLVALEQRRWRDCLVFGALVSLQFVAFEPLMFQSSLLLLAALTLLHVLESEDRRRAAVQSLEVGGAGFAFGLALSAVQVIPTLELLSRSARIAGIDFRNQSFWSMHPADFLNVIIPNLFGSPYTMYRPTYWGELYHEGREAYLVSVFLGTGAAVLALLSFLSARRKLQIALTSVALIGSFLALGKFIPLYSWFYDHVPLLRLGRYPSKYFLLSTLALTIMCSLGLEVALSQRTMNVRRTRQTMMFGFGGMVVAALLIGMWIYLLLSPAYLAALIRSNLIANLAPTKDLLVITLQLRDSIRLSGVFLLVLSTVVYFSSRGRRIPFLGELLVLILGAELASSNLRVSPFISDADVNFRSEVNSYLERTRRTGPYRVASLDSLRLRPPILGVGPVNRSWAWFTLFWRMSGQPMYGIMNGIQYSLDQSVDYLNTLESDILSRVCFALPDNSCLALLCKLNSPIVLAMEEIHDQRARFLSSFAVLSANRLKVYELEDASPRTMFVSGVEYSSSHEDALKRFLATDFPYMRRVILEGARAEEKAGQDEAGAARVLNYLCTRVLCEVEARASGYLVLLDSYYPGWRAYLDGRESEIRRANYAFRAVEVPAGRHRVEFVYRPRSFYTGLSLTSLALLVGVAALFWKPRRRSLRSGETE